MCASIINESGNIIELTRYVQCEYNPNCDFKQLKRKEQECEELKREIAFGNNGKLSDKIRALVFKDLNNENSKYKQALDEIENITKGYCKNMCMTETKETCDGCQNTEILNIINKVKGGNNNG